MTFEANSNSWQSSFEPDWTITPDGGNVTVVSGSSGFGKHASLFLEYYEIPFLQSPLDTLTRVKAPIQEFKRKSEETGRYTYVAPGGVLGFMFSKIGQRGVNCAGFVVKVLDQGECWEARQWPVQLTVPSNCIG
jgi:hypothetical protein